MSTRVYCGVDLGSQKTIIVAKDGERILTSTGGTSRPTAVSFQGRSRLMGEEVIPQLMGENTVTFLNKLIGASYREVMNNLNDVEHQPFGFVPYTRMSIVPLSGNADDDSSMLGIQVSYSGPPSVNSGLESFAVFSVPALLGMYLGSVVEQVRASCDEQNGQKDASSFVLSFPLPESSEGKSSPEIVRTLREACSIAGIPPDAVHVTTTTECLARAYSRKLSALKAGEKTHLEGNAKVMLVEMGCTQSAVLIVEVQPDLQNVKVVANMSSPALGAFYYDLAIFRHLANICKEKHQLTIVPGTKAGLRFLAACERLRKLLSQLPEASVTVENLSDEVGDLTFSLRRDELEKVGESVTSRFKNLISTTFTSAGLTGSELSAVEIMGGGVRMQIVQDAIIEFTGPLPLGAKLDEGSIAVGAALIASPESESETESHVLNSQANGVEGTEQRENLCENHTAESKWALSDGELKQAIEMEAMMQQQDRDIVQLLERRNEMESYIFEMRGCVNQKHGNLVSDPTALREICDEHENWLWDNGDTASLEDILCQFTQLKNKLEGEEVEVVVTNDPSSNDVEKRRQGGICSEYLSVVAKEKKEVEEMLAKEAAAAQLERKDDEEQDHDTRKLRKPERMRLVVKNKEEGTELFKGGNVRPAAARYQKALTHAAKFFDLSPDDIEEVNSVKLSLHLNLTQCYLKLENWDSAIRHADEALALDDKAVKALFRRAQAWEAKKEYDKALLDMKIAAELNAPKEDKLITKGMERIKKLIQKEKDKEKKVWGKVFS